MTSTAALLLRLLAVLGLFRVLGLPIARAAFPRLRVTAYALATGVALVLAGHVTWLLASAGLRIGPVTVALGVAATALVSGLALRRSRAARAAAGASDAPATVAPLLPTLREAAIVHGAFLLAFTLALLVTARNPSVDPDSERFMDYAMVNAVVSSRALPLEDPWLAAERVSYYDYGYYASGYLAIWTGSTEHLFPVAVALLFAALFAGVTALGLDLAGPLGAVLAGFLVCLAGNLDALVQTVTNGFAGAIDWFVSARVLTGCITEFPYFTLLWGDLHPYALALPLWPVLLATAAAYLGASRHDATDDPPLPPATGVTLLVGAVTYAALIATHTWDAVPVASLLGLVTLGALVRRRAAGDAAGAPDGAATPGDAATAEDGSTPGDGGDRHAGASPGPGRARARFDHQPLLAPLGVIVLGALLAMPFLLHAPTGGRGLAWVAKRSTLAELGTAWGGPLALLLPAVLVDALRKPTFRGRGAPLFAFVAGYVIVSFGDAGVGLAFAVAGAALALALVSRGTHALAWMMAATGAGLVAGVELLFVDDFYGGELERMNTVFKAYVEAWVLLGLAAALLAPAVIAAARRSSRLRTALAAGLVLLVVGATALYPLRATRARAGDLLSPVSLDARTAFRERYPDDAAAAEALRSLPRGRLLETTGDAYSWNGRFATFTGYPAAVGWAHHEAGWRNDWNLPMERARDVREAYSAIDAGKLDALTARLGIAYVVVGELERAQYPAAALEKFTRLQPAVRAGSTVVYRARSPQ